MSIKTFPPPLASRANTEIYGNIERVTRHIAKKGLENGTVTVFRLSSNKPNSENSSPPASPCRRQNWNG
jgi:hypothetical protein